MKACTTLDEIASQKTKLQEVSPDHAKAVETTNKLIIEILKTIMEKRGYLLRKLKTLFYLLKEYMIIQQKQIPVLQKKQRF